MRIGKRLVLIDSMAVGVAVGLTGCAPAGKLTLPLSQRPAWLARDGIVMAGSWEPLLFRVRRDGAEGYTPTPEQRAGYQREHSPEMVAELKALGVNFVMMHCYKGGGARAEADSMADAVKFSKLCHDEGLRVGVYNYSGAFIWELFFQEAPPARDWLVLDADGQPIPYYRTARYRYFWNRNHPEAQAFYRKLVKFAVEDIRTDLVHFDNYNVGPGSEPVSAERFRRYLTERFTPQQREAMGVRDVSAVQPPLKAPPTDPLRRAWLDFTSQSLADSFADMSRYARTLRPDILMEVNPGGPGEAIYPPVDHGRLLQGGEAFWDEGHASGFHDGKLSTRIRTYKIGRRMDNVAFAYTLTPVEAAEAMAFNLDSFGCICWFEYGRIVNRPGGKDPVSADLPPYVRFFHQRRDLLRDAQVIADVAVLRSFPSQAFADPKSRQLTARIEQAMIAHRVPFQIIYDQHLDDLARYRTLVLAGCVAMSDQQIAHVERFVRQGGRLCIVGESATHDEWMNPRPTPRLADLPPDRLARIAEDADPVAAARDLGGGQFSVTVDAKEGVCAEFTRQLDGREDSPGRTRRQMVHLVNYDPDRPAENVRVRLQLPSGHRAARITLASPETPSDMTVLFDQTPGTVTFTVPTVKVYTIAIIDE